MGGISGLDLAGLGIPSDTEYLAEYCTNTGIKDVNTWNFYLSFAFFRIAAILQGVYKRSLQSKRNEYKCYASILYFKTKLVVRMLRMPAKLPSSSLT